MQANEDPFALACMKCEGVRMTYADDGNVLDMVLEALRLLAGILLGHVVRSRSEYLGMRDDQDTTVGYAYLDNSDARRFKQGISRNRLFY